jgi:hypothetical protein
VVFGVILGTGVGGGIVVDGKVLTGANAIAGEWGHNPMPGEDHKDVCYCGRKGCIELYLSGPGLASDHRRVASADFPATEIAARAANGDTQCEATLQRYESRLARALAQGHQHPRSRCHRARRRPVQHRPPLPKTCRACGASTSFPTRWPPGCSSIATAIRPA